MGRKSRLKWERRKRDGWHPCIGKLGAYYRALATGVPMKGPPRIEAVDEANRSTHKALTQVYRFLGTQESPDV